MVQIESNVLSYHYYISMNSDIITFDNRNDTFNSGGHK